VHWFSSEFYFCSDKKKYGLKGIFQVYKVSVAALKFSVCAIDNTLHKLMDETNGFICAW